MQTYRICVTVGLLGSLGFGQVAVNPRSHREATPPVPRPVKSTSVEVPYRHRLSGSKTIHQQDLSAAFAYIVNSEYDVRWHHDTHTYRSANRRQGMRFTYLPNGFVAQPLPRDRKVHSWQIALRLRAYGSRDPVDAGATSGSKANGHAIQIRTAQVIYDYRNDPAGMRQNFTIEKRPKTGHLRLELAAALQGVQMRVDKSGNAAYFVDAATRRQVMRYADLNVWDAKGCRLPARMAMLSRRVLAIDVDDSHAHYPVTVDPLTEAWSLSGQSLSYATGGQFGFSVAASSASLDSTHTYGFIVVGAPYWVDDSGYQWGKVFVFAETSTGINSTPYWSAQGPQQNDGFGYSVAVSDGSKTLNGDSYPDIVVGAPYYAFYGTQDGEVFVWYGNSAGGFPSSASWSSGYDPSNSQFGFSLAIAHDLRSSTDSDALLIGDPYYNSSPYTDIGAAYAYYGSTSGLGSSADWSVEEPSSNSGAYFGYSIGVVHAFWDGNASHAPDSLPEVVIGAPYDGSGGEAFVYKSSSSGLSSSYSTLSESGTGAFGASVAGIANFQKVTLSDSSVVYPGAIAIGAPDTTANGASGAGMVWVWPDAMSPISISLGVNAQQNAKFGFSVAGGDVSGDGYGDLVVGEPYRVNTQGGTHHEGSVYLLISNQGGGFQAIGYVHNDTSNADSYFGWSLAFAPKLSGSLNGVGFLVGVPYPSSYGDVEAWWY